MHVNNRVLLKLSGEALAGHNKHGVCPETLKFVANQIAGIHAEGYDVGIVVGGGNFCRGASLDFLQRSVADDMGMLATVMNGLSLQDYLSKENLVVKLYSAIHIPNMANPINIPEIEQSLSERKIAIFVGGTGSHFVTTDTAASVRALQIRANMLLKITNVDGVYDKNPKLPDAKLLHKLTFKEAIEKNLEVMDRFAFEYCHKFKLPIKVFNIYTDNMWKNVITDSRIGSLITD